MPRHRRGTTLVEVTAAAVIAAAAMTAAVVSFRPQHVLARSAAAAEASRRHAACDYAPLLAIGSSTSTRVRMTGNRTAASGYVIETSSGGTFVAVPNTAYAWANTVNCSASASEIVFLPTGNAATGYSVRFRNESSAVRELSVLPAGGVIRETTL